MPKRYRRMCFPLPYCSLIRRMLSVSLLIVSCRRERNPGYGLRYAVSANAGDHDGLRGRGQRRFDFATQG